MAWASAMVDPVPFARTGGFAVTLDIDAAWFARVRHAGALGPINIRGARLDSRRAFVPLSSVRSTMAATPVNGQAKHALAAAVATAALMRSDAAADLAAMRVGARPAAYETNAAASDDNNGVILVHGYCAPSGDTCYSFPPDAYGSKAVLFEVWHVCDGPLRTTAVIWFALDAQDFESNRSQDEFALILRDFGDARLSSFGLVAHSQGGLAATHLVCPGRGHRCDVPYRRLVVCVARVLLVGPGVSDRRPANPIGRLAVHGLNACRQPRAHWKGACDVARSHTRVSRGLQADIRQGLRNVRVADAGWSTAVAPGYP